MSEWLPEDFWGEAEEAETKAVLAAEEKARKIAKIRGILDTEEGRSKLAQAMVAPIRAAMAERRNKPLPLYTKERDEH